MPLESSHTFSPSRRRFLQVLLAVATSSCNSSPIYKYNEGFLADPRFNTGGELESLVETSSYEDPFFDSRRSVDQLILTSRQAFMNAPVGEWKDRLPEGKVTVLYPAAGVHIMPLQLGYRIMRQDSKVNEVEFIYTEVDSDAKIGFEQQLAILAKLGLVRNINVKTQYYPDNNSRLNLSLGIIPHETTYTFDALEPSGKSHRLSVVYALHMSGTDLFRKEYAQRASILISHDSESSTTPKEMVSAALKVGSSGRYEGKHDVILLAEPEYVISGLIQNMFPFIHPEHGNPFKTARDKDFPNKIKLIQGDYGCHESFVSGYMLMMYLDKGFVNSELGQRSLSKYFKTIIKP